jgi:hypothetical protein
MMFFFTDKSIVMAHKITNLYISIPQKSSGGVIHQETVSFDVYKMDGHYSLRPCLDTPGRQILNLPEELNFVFRDGKPESLRGNMDGNFHVIQDAVALLKKDGIVQV